MRDIEHKYMMRKIKSMRNPEEAKKLARFHLESALELNRLNEFLTGDHVYETLVVNEERQSSV